MFKSLDFNHTSSFNSDNSFNLIDTINKAIDIRCVLRATQPHKQVFAPSSAYCDRKIWFRFRGVNPDTPTSTDYYNEFVKMIGDACHIYIQSLLKETLGEDWIDVGEYLKGINTPYEYTTEVDGYETHVAINDPPICFSVDGIIKYRGKLYLIEIKSLEHNSFSEIFEPRERDVSQTATYQLLLGIEDVMYIYIDRLYGNVKCFEYRNSIKPFDDIVNHCREIKQMADAMIAPPKCYLPSVCSMCEYKQRCKEW